MKILSLDTGGAQAGFAVVEAVVDSPGAIAHSTVRVIEQSRRLSREIMLEIASLLDEAKWTLDDIDAIATGLGPGSWTGLRIGLTTAKTLAQVRELPLVGVPTLDAVFEGFKAGLPPSPGEKRVIAVAPCRAGEIYLKSWHCEDGEGRNWAVTAAERIVPLSAAAGEMSFPSGTSSSAVCLIAPSEGHGAAQEIARQLAVDAPHCAAEIVEVPTAAIVQNIALIAARRLQSGPGDDVLTLAPLYLAPSNAERNLAEKMARKIENKQEA